MNSCLICLLLFRNFMEIENEINLPELSESLLGRIPLIGPCSWGDGIGGCAGDGVLNEA